MPRETKLLPSKEYLLECFEYNSESGDLYWKVRPITHFSSSSISKQINSKHANTKAGHISTNGYVSVFLGRRQIAVHRIIWKIITGSDPIGIWIDHKNRIKTDNRFENLRLATQAENSRNRNRKNQCVTLHKKTNKWQASVSKLGKSYYLGLFANKEDAISAANKARKELFGEFMGEA